MELPELNVGTSGYQLSAELEPTKITLARWLKQNVFDVYVTVH